MGEPHVLGIFHTAPLTYDIAREAAARYRDGAIGVGDAVVAVVFAVTAVEALVGEVAELSLDWQRERRGGDVVSRFADVMTEVEAARGSAQLKMRLAPTILGAESFNEQAEPFSSYLLLVALRNVLIHSRPARIYVTLPPKRPRASHTELDPASLQLAVPDVFRRLRETCRRA